MMDVIMPKWGMTMQEATISCWLKAEGDAVENGEPIVEVETDKVQAAIEAPIAGTLTQQAAAVGDAVRVGALVAIIDPA
jgi:pyruvate dehydrogenase E2 component (dihydrolipoamide acetyltransferase)